MKHQFYPRCNTRMILVLNVLTILFDTLVCAIDDPILIKLRPEQILETFQSVMSSEHLRNLANDFAKKAAVHLIGEMKKQEVKTTLRKRPPIHKNLLDTSIVNKAEVLTLLQDPSPDGDNLDAELALSEEITRATTRERGPMKINGAYYRRVVG